jgi:hypothetical protein
VAYSCEHGNEHPEYVKGGKYFDLFNECQLLQNDTAP